MSYCLPQKASQKFLEALRAGKIVPAKLAEMSSAERRAFFEDIVGKENVVEVNAQLESKLILKDQKRGMVTWAKKLSGISEAARTDMLSKIQRLDKVLDAQSERAFLEDLAAKKLGTDITFEEASKITEMAKEVETRRGKVPDDSPIRSQERLEYGLSYTLFKDYVDGLKGRAAESTWKEWARSPGQMFYSLAGTTKSLLSSLDNSFFGRQGVKVLYTHPSIWAKNFLKSWGDIAKELRRIDAMQAIKADVYSRPNALNGKYEAMKLDIGIASEEAFPTSLPAKIPILGRLYKASESAFQGAALRMRADYADRLIVRAEEFGVNFKDKEQAHGVGKLINSMTGRGEITQFTEGGSRGINVAVFSIKFFKSNFDVLTAHRLGFAIEKGPARSFARREAATNLLKIILTQQAILFTANVLNPGSVDFDPRSSRFGKIKLGNHYHDISGGMGSLITLASRITPTFHNGKLSMWYKSGSTGKWTDLWAGKYGQLTGLDLLENFGEGKLSPIAGLFRDLLAGQNFQGDKVTVGSAIKNLVTPLSIQTAEQMAKVEDLTSPAGIAGLILEGLGLGSSTFQKR